MKEAELSAMLTKEDIKKLETELFEAKRKKQCLLNCLDYPNIYVRKKQFYFEYSLFRFAFDMITKGTAVIFGSVLLYGIIFLRETLMIPTEILVISLVLQMLMNYSDIDKSFTYKGIKVQIDQLNEQIMLLEEVISNKKKNLNNI
ncbi:hypothetical protein [Enterococcus faecalis]|uniref:hypothetical protein n=1 Tax=Enterococcus faecalis TaxID=1351 RepID=UPI0025B0854F|nr:hypothetical protein [Enterococcus faecalis]MDN3185430.1 hypothetical protein [Enterococcus faecalis]